VPFDAKAVRVKFYPHPDEIAWAAAKRARHGGRYVVINQSGSSVAKWWPHAQKAMDLFAAQGVGGAILGDLRDEKLKPPEGWEVIGTSTDIRRCYALAALADVVIGTESAIVNSVAHEAPLKMVLLSHSTAHQLTRDWERTIALEPDGLPCYPCHRIHATFAQCAQDKATRAAVCQSSMTAEVIVDYAMQYMRGEIGDDRLAGTEILAEVA
jgi:ADP-heptose:LPS heptosyltransferase